MHDEVFHVDCYSLPLNGFDLVLGVQWLETLGPIVWDSGTWPCPFGAPITLFIGKDMGLARWRRTLVGEEGDLMNVLLEEFATLFPMPCGLPPACQCNHCIQLEAGTNAVAIRQYRYPKLQKDKIEIQCKEMMK